MAKTEEKARLPFDGYDFFGYMLPGFVFLSLLAVCLPYYLGDDFWQYYTLITQLRTDLYLTSVVFFLITAYVLGHVVASVSAILYDRIIVQKIFGYPYNRIIFPGEWSENYRKTCFYRVQVSLLYLALAFYIARGFFYREFDVGVWKWIGAAFLVLTLLRWIEDGWGHSGYCAPAYKGVSAAFTKVLYVGALPFRLVESLFRHLFGLDTPISEAGRERFLTAFKTTFKTSEPRTFDNDVYWLTYIYCCRRSPLAAQMMYRWLVLYGLMRNLAGAFLMSSLAFAIVHRYSPGNAYVSIGAWLCLILSVIACVRYYYLYYNYFSKFVFRCFIELFYDPLAENEASAAARDQ